MAQASDDHSAVLSYANTSRAEYGTVALGTHGQAAAIAQRHAERMSNARSIFHNSNLEHELTASGVAWSLVGENVGVGPSAEAIRPRSRRDRRS